MCRDLGIGFVAYSPLGRGLLTGQIKTFEDLAADDYRRSSPRFQGEDFAQEPRARCARGRDRQGEELQAVAARSRVGSCSGSGYCSHSGYEAARISTRTSPHSTSSSRRRISTVLLRLMPRGAVAGARYPETMMRAANG